jgi:hypothetical protein
MPLLDVLTLPVRLTTAAVETTLALGPLGDQANRLPGGRRRQALEV